MRTPVSGRRAATSSIRRASASGCVRAVWSSRSTASGWLAGIRGPGARRGTGEEERGADRDERQRRAGPPGGRRGAVRDAVAHPVKRDGPGGAAAPRRRRRGSSSSASWRAVASLNVTRAVTMCRPGERPHDDLERRRRPGGDPLAVQAEDDARDLATADRRGEPVRAVRTRPARASRPARRAPAGPARAASGCSRAVPLLVGTVTPARGRRLGARSAPVPEPGGVEPAAAAWRRVAHGAVDHVGVQRDRAVAGERTPLQRGAGVHRDRRERHHVARNAVAVPSVADVPTCQ